MKYNKVLKRIGVVLAFVVIAVIGLHQYKQEQLVESLSQKILRFHVLANSDSQQDQELKLKVRDAIGGYMQQELKEVTNMEESKKIILEDIEKIEQTAKETIAQQGYSYGVEVSLAKVNFPRKIYGSYSFPKGEYQALQVIIGEGKGKNWWCVMYPNMCFQGSMYEVIEEEAEEELRQVLTNEEYKAVMESKDYDIKFKWLSFLN